MHISELARKTGVSLRSLRYYEEQKLLNPVRLDNGYRKYNEIDIELIRRIQLYLRMGLTTKEIADIFHCGINEDIKYECLQSGIAKGKVKLNEIRREIELLQAAEAQLSNLVEDLEVMLAKGD